MNTDGITIVNGSYDSMQIYIASRVKEYYTKFLRDKNISVILTIYSRISLFGDKYKFTVKSKGESLTFPSNEDEYAELYSIIHHIS